MIGIMEKMLSILMGIMAMQFYLKDRYIKVKITTSPPIGLKGAAYSTASLS
jgi:uncharacterized protein YneF (UPF0154 family)